jgi:hypothetical protein
MVVTSGCVLRGGIQNPAFLLMEAAATVRKEARRKSLSGFTT